MILKKLRLYNIRSYVAEELDFPEGSILLSGDIGAGKSTILLAIDFALFGLRKPDLSGAALLRNGEKEGYVELQLEIDGKDIVIKRTLKRTKTSVSQDAGYVIEDGTKYDGTAVEIKSRIIKLLNYPKEFLTKSKSLIYKYTVYTPQEEMKHILFDSQDARLDTLRKVFGIDKYKQIKENSRIFLSSLKEKKKEFQGRTHDLEEKKQQSQQHITKLAEVQQKRQSIQPSIEMTQKQTEQKQQEIQIVEEKINEAKELKNQSSLKTQEKDQKIQRNQAIEQELRILGGDLIKLQQEVKEPEDKTAMAQELQDYKDKLSALETETKTITSQVLEIEVKKRNAEDLKNKIDSLEVCPTCTQVVTYEHKKKIKTEQDNSLTQDLQKLTLLQQQQTEKQLHNEAINKKIDILNKKINEIELNSLKHKSFQEKQAQKQKLDQELEQNKIRMTELSKEIEILTTKASTYSNYEELYTAKKQELEDIREKFQNLKIQDASYKRELEDINQNIDRVKEEITKKEKAKSNIGHLGQMQQWIEEYFINLMDVMEKKIMFKVHTDFDILFQKWFSTLIDNEAFQIKLDESFTPLIEQNGHDIEYNFLSGGEKTAAALAYRLSLNQVINGLMRNIKTHDLLILDEPTDGFSGEQLDRVKTILEELKLKQIVIVSHEPKIETFVNHIVRLNKENHTTKILQ